MYSLLPEVAVRGSSKGTIPKDKTCKDADSRIDVIGGLVAQLETAIY